MLVVFRFGMRERPVLGTLNFLPDLAERDIECRSQLVRNSDAYEHLTQLDGAHVGAVDASFIRKLLLGPAGCQSSPANHLPEQLLNALLHQHRVSRCRRIVYRVKIDRRSSTLDCVLGKSGYPFTMSRWHARITSLAANASGLHACVFRPYVRGACREIVVPTPLTLRGACLWLS